MQLNTGTITVLNNFERPVLVIALVARMLVGLGLAIAVFVQLYMLILTDLRCDPASTSLGNLIRCTDIIEMVAATVALIAAIGFIAALFSPKRMVLIDTLTMILLAVVLRFVAGVEISNASWEIALTIAALFASFGGLVVFRAYQPEPEKAPAPRDTR